MSKSKLVLFDIDQTILNSGGAGEKSLRLALRDRFGRDDDLARVEIAGRTDALIARRIFELHGIEPTPENIEEFLQGYLHHLQVELARLQGHLLPGFPAILERLAGMPHIALGLLTGNVRRGAEIKLRHYGVWQYFAYGGFADDSHDRNLLGPFARDRAQAAHGVTFAGPDTFVIGDTPHDIACGKAFDAKTVGVATGNFTRAQLQEHHPDFLFDDLGDIDHVLETLGLHA